MTHEFIDYRQGQALGMLGVRSKPRWLIEGMAYSLGDPRRPLPPRLEVWRGAFERWYASPDVQHDLWWRRVT